MLKYENRVWKKGYHLAAGLDEVGRGCLAGPVTAAAVIFPRGLRIPGVTDSKGLTAIQREKLYHIIISRCISVGVGFVDEKTIDIINIKQAARLAMKKAVNSLRIYPDYLLIDAESVDLDLPQESIIKGDLHSHSIAAASIVAKVVRDRACIEWDRVYPRYGFKSNKGYHSKKHRGAIKTYGPCPLHRESFIQGILDERTYNQPALF